MSSLRVATLRFCWLEAFIAVVEEENISEAANILGVNQSTVSRYMQSLENWLDKKLIEPGKVVDPDNSRVSIGITEDGDRFYDISKDIIAKIAEFRGEETIKKEIIKRSSDIISRMRAGLGDNPRSDVAEGIRSNIEIFEKFLDEIDRGSSFSTDLLLSVGRNLISFFNIYEVERNRERRRRRASR